MKLAVCILLTAVSMSLVACSGSQIKDTAAAKTQDAVTTAPVSQAQYAPAKEESARPAWVDNCQAEMPEGSALMCGVGISAPELNESLQWDLVAERARDDLAAKVQTVVRRMSIDYRDKHMDYFNPTTAGSSEFVSFISKRVTSYTLKHTSLKRWQDPKTKTMYAVAQIDFGKEFAEKYKKDLREAVLREEIVVKAKADKAIADMDAEVGKQIKSFQDILKTPVQQ